jgi:hypothetical protein
MKLTITFYHRVLVFVVLLLVTGCGTTTSVSNPASITPQFTQLVSDVNDLASTSTITVGQTFTPLPSATPNQTQIVQADNISSTISVAQTSASQFPRICKDSYYRQGYSPDGLWLVELCYSENDHDLIMTLSSRETQVLWKLLYQKYIPKMDFVPDGGMSVVRWSNDGKYAYFTAFLGGDGGECFYGNQLETGTGLFRLDLKTGLTTVILPPNDRYFWYSFSISPTDRRLVYGVHSLNLKILDITTGQLVDVVHKSDFSEGGGYIWSPDGLQFVYATVTSDDQGERFGYSLRLVDAKSGSEQILLESTEDCFAARSWKENNILTLEKNFNKTLIEYDLKSNTIISENTMTP